MADRPAVHVFEPSPLGHRPLFLAWLLSDPPTERRWILHTTSSVRRHPALRALLGKPPAHLAVVDLRRCPDEPTVKTALNLLRYQVHKAVSYRRNWLRHARPGDCAFIPWYDDFTLAFTLLPWLTAGMPFTTIGMRAQFHQQRQGVLTSLRHRGHGAKEFLLRRLLLRRHARCYLTNQLPLKHDVDQRWGALARKVRFYPDPAVHPTQVPVAEARRRLGLPEDRQVVLCYGSLTMRKGVDHLLNALEDPAWPAQATAVCAGVYREGVGELLAGPRAEALVARGRLHRRAGFVDELTENLLFEAATAVWLVYDRHDGMSACLVQAGQHRRPVVACANGLIGWYVAATRGGVIYDPGQRAESLAALSRLLSEAEDSAAAGERLHACFRDHTMAVFRACIHAAILERPEPRKWL